MVRQVYHVKKDCRKDRNLDLNLSEGKPIHALKALGINSKEMKQTSVDVFDVKSEPKKLGVSRAN